MDKLKERIYNGELGFTKEELIQIISECNVDHLFAGGKGEGDIVIAIIQIKDKLFAIDCLVKNGYYFDSFDFKDCVPFMQPHEVERITETFTETYYKSK